MNVQELRKLALRKIITKHSLGYVFRYGLGKPWVESDELNEMAWTDFKKIYMNMGLLDESFNRHYKSPTVDPTSQFTADSKAVRFSSAMLGALAHECLHNMWLHKSRAKDKQRKLWDIACEWSINWYLTVYYPYFVKDLGVMYPPLEAIVWLEHRGQAVTTDGFYQYLLENSSKAPELLDSCRHCSHKGSDGEGEEDLFEQLNVARGLPDDDHKREVMQYITNACTKVQRIPWEQLLLGGIEDAMEQEQTWARPNRRQEGLPGWRREKLLSFTWVLDVSPSIDDDMKRSFVNTLQAGINLYHDAQHRVIFFAGGIEGDITIGAGTDLSKMEIPSGSSTDLSDVWEILEEDKPDYALVLTDLELAPVPEPSHTKVVWGVVGDYSHFNPEYGVRIDLPDLN